MKVTRLSLRSEELLKVIQDKINTEGIPTEGTFNLNMSSITLMDPEKAPKAEILIHPDAYSKMLHIIMANDKEVAWHGTVQKRGHQYIILDVMLYPQIASAATVDANETEYVKWITQFGEDINRIRMQGHSHVNMGTFASGTDLTYYQDLSRQTNNYYIFLIMNKKGEANIRLFDKINQLLYTEMPLLILDRNYQKQAENQPLPYYNMHSWYKTQDLNVKTLTYTNPGYSPAVPGRTVHRPVTTPTGEGAITDDYEIDAFTNKWNKTFKKETDK